MKITVFAAALTFFLILFSCSSPGDTKQDSASAHQEPEILTEIIATKNGDQKLQKVTEGSIMPHGIIKTVGSKELLSTKHFTGKPLVINFWATWCKPCLTDTPAFQSMAASYPDVEFISVSIDRNEDDWNSFLQAEQWTGNHYWLGMNKADPFYTFVYSDIQSDDVSGVHVALPKYVIIDQSGTIVNKSFPGPGTPVFKEMLDKHLL